ncbi:ion channel CASTOR [Salix suchowensis]|nr:ion channel CASTOR [Salix suchowensis]
MSLDSQDSPSPSFNRDWFFPSPSFFHQSPPKPPKPHRRFSTASKHSPDSNLSNPPSFRSSSSFSPTTTSKYGRLRRRMEFPRAPDKYSRQHQNDFVLDRKLAVSNEKKQSTEKLSTGSLGHRVRVRWNLAITVAIVITALTSLVHKNFTLHNQVIVLQDQILKLNVRLRACNMLSNVDIFDSVTQEHDDIGYRSDNGLKNLALIVSLTLLSIPVLAFKYIDFVSKSRSSDSALEEVLLNKQLAYRVDVFLSVHPYAKPLALLVATLLVICLVVWRIGPRLVSVSISFGGMLIFAMMLGLVSDAISEKFDSLRKGRSEVVEQNHTLILGWSDKLGSLLNQLAIANESLGGGIVVVMAERDKEEMEMDIAKMEFDFKGTSVICRSGSPLILADLKKARAIVVLAEDGNADQSDARALRTVLSLTGVKEGLKGHIVVELSDLDNEVLVKLVGGDLVETVVAHDVIGRLMIQCARQPGLAQIWEDILGFENCEFYIKRWPQLHGMQFEDILISFPDAIPCGIKVASCGGKIILNPEDSYVLQEDDEILVIAEDDDSYAPAALPTVWRGSLPKDFIVQKSAERILFCGWRRDMEDMIMVLDAFLAPGSELWMFNDVPENERERKLIDGGLDFSRLENIQLVNREGNAVIRRQLESLPLHSFDSILILADESVEDSAIQADSRSLATLLLIRDIQSKRLPMVNQVRRGSFSQGSWIGEMQQASDKSVIISEILDPRTKNLLCTSKISDYVLSNELVSMALAMVAEDQQINDVLEELFAEEGNELQIRQADLYLSEGEEMSFYEVLLRARQRREIVIGYRAANAERAVINPPAKTERRRWSLKDAFVVIAEKE